MPYGFTSRPLRKEAGKQKGRKRNGKERGERTREGKERKREAKKKWLLEKKACPCKILLENFTRLPGEAPPRNGGGGIASAFTETITKFEPMVIHK